jgi:hypothetical protein
MDASGMSGASALSSSLMLLYRSSQRRSTPSPSLPSPRRCPSCVDYEGAIESHSQVHSQYICEETRSRAGREVTRRLRAEMRRVNGRAMEGPVSPSVAKAS